MKDVYLKNPQMGDPASLDHKLTEVSQNIEKLRLEAQKFEVWKSCCYKNRNRRGAWCHAVTVGTERQHFCPWGSCGWKCQGDSWVMIKGKIHWVFCFSACPILIVSLEIDTAESCIYLYAVLFFNLNVSLKFVLLHLILIMCVIGSVSSSIISVNQKTQNINSNTLLFFQRTYYQKVIYVTTSWKYKWEISRKHSFLKTSQ